MKKLVSLLLVMIMATALLAGCAKEEPAAKTETKTETKTEAKTEEKKRREKKKKS